jgi:hypothetical protein
MSTKTTFKRIALVAVAAMGFGTLSVVAAPVASAAATSLALSTSSITIVGGSTSDTPAALVRIDVTSDTYAQGGLADGSTVSAAITAVPTSVTAKTLAANGAAFTDTATAWTSGKADLLMMEAKGQTSGGYTDWRLNTLANIDTVATQAERWNGSITSANSYYYGMEAGTDTAASMTKSYYVSIMPMYGASVIDQGAYTITFTLKNAAGDVKGTQTLKVDFVTSRATSGAVLSLAKGGTFTAGAALGTGAAAGTTYASVTLKNRDSGVLRGYTGAPETPTVTLVTSAGVDTSTGIMVSDTGTAGNDFGNDTDENLIPDNGVFGITKAALPYVAGTYTLKAEYGNATAVTSAITVYDATTATSAASTITVKADGISVLDTTSPYLTPLTTKSATFTVRAASASGIVANLPITFQVAYAGAYGSGAVSPAADADPSVVFTDSSGLASITVTNSSPSDSSTATVTATGFTSGSLSAVVNWQKSNVTTVTQTSSQKAKYASTNVITATVTDQWGAPMAGILMQPAITAGANKNTVAFATVTTDAAGQASLSVTDALADATTTTDTVKFTAVASGVVGSTTITYVTAVPVIGSLTGYYNLTETATSFTTPIPTAGIYADAAGTKLIAGQTRNITKSVATDGITTDDLVGFRFVAKDAAGAIVSGVPVVVTVSSGGYIKGSSTLRATSRTIIAAATTGYVDFIGGSDLHGAITFTVTAGSVVSTASIWVSGNADAADARFVKLTGAATGAANGALLPYTATVTDRYGNPVSGVTLTIQATGVASFAGGSTLQSFTTDSTGVFTFAGTSYNAAGGAGSFKVTATSPTAHFSSLAGYVSATAVESTLAAGNSSASVAVTFSEGVNAAEANAQAASDAAAEATDAANAATDAANAAAEAADAATAAAQDAADAVAALSAQVASLISGLKAQLTALTNLVIKIQQKVKA